MVQVLVPVLALELEQAAVLVVLGLVQELVESTLFSQVPVVQKHSCLLQCIRRGMPKL